ncbi:MAG: DUF1648 domain-containing protein [Saprospiraceae bacterium]|nr:DUF1648 domain-containing protein [Saprospiraceae bacterium]MDW8230730.1 DUF1648 domain-containing protein [Saprospiraceae bacterium]
MGRITRKQPQPKIALEWTLADRLLEAVATFFAVLLMAVPLAYYRDLPERIPQHFNAAGEVDAYGPKYLLLIPVGMGILLFGIMTWLSRHPHWLNYPVTITPDNAERQYRLAVRLLRVLKMVVVLLFLYLAWNTTRIGMGKAESLPPALLWVVLGGNGAILLWYFTAAFRSRKP